MPWNLSLLSALRYSDIKPATSGASAGSGVVGTRPTEAETSAIWFGQYRRMQARVRAVGITVGTTSGTPAQQYLADIEAKYTTGHQLIALAGHAGREVAPQGLFYLSCASAELSDILKAPGVLSSLSGATMAAGFAMGVSGRFNDAKSSLSSISAENDVTWFRERSF